MPLGTTKISQLAKAFGLLWTFCQSAGQASGQSTRQKLAELLIENLQSEPALFQGTPITHIVPEFNHVTYALNLRLLNIQTKDDSNFRRNNEPKLIYSGWDASAYLALSLKKIGIGFNVEAGKKSIDYEHATGQDKVTQNSTANYRGVGIYLFYKPMDWKEVIPSLTLGGKSLSANHEIGFAMTESSRATSSAKSVKENYSIYEYSAGLNTQFKFVKPVTVIPWVDYVGIEDSAARALSSKPGLEWIKSDYEDDLKILWSDRRPLNYGIDFAVNIVSFEVRIGGLLGGIVTSGVGPDHIEDRSVRVAFAWNQKG